MVLKWPVSLSLVTVEVFVPLKVLLLSLICSQTLVALKKYPTTE